jgi:membrane fusion protein, multidrug efflux system
MAEPNSQPSEEKQGEVHPQWPRLVQGLTPAKKSRVTLKNAFGIFGALLALFLFRPTLSEWIRNYSDFESTDDAVIVAPTAAVSAKIGGIVTKVFFKDFMKVKKGQVLVELDDREIQFAKQRLESERDAARAGYWEAKNNLDRAKYLFNRGYRSQQEFQAVQARYYESLARERTIQAQLDQTTLELEYSKIQAPMDATVGKREVEPGMVIKAAQTMTEAVDSSSRWIVANFKETQLNEMRVGQKVEIEIDAIKGKKFSGVVESFAPGSGASFALIPPDNATGNFTKVVQRVPVKIVLSEDSIRNFEDVLVPGMSAYAKVRVVEAK